MELTRKQLMKLLFGASVGGACGAVAWSFLAGPHYPDVPPGRTAQPAKASELPPGQSKQFSFFGRPTLLIHRTDGTWTALDAVCTHKSCIVHALPTQGIVLCPCHKGRYDLDGKRVAGPPPAPLRVYDVVVNGDQVVVRS